jgi:hypothetical protein
LVQSRALTEKSGKTTHFLNAEYHYENGDIIITEYDVDNVEINKHYIPESEVKEIKYEG